MAERIDGLSIGLSLDTIQVDSGLQSLKSKMSLLNSEAKANMSAFDRGEKSVAKYGVQIEGLNKKLDAQKVVTEAARKNYEKMTKEFGEGSKESEKAATNYNNQVATLNNLERHVEGVTKEMKEFTEQQRIADSGWTKVGTKMESMGGKLKSVSNKMMGVGKTMSLYVTAPLVGVGVAATKTSIEFEAQMSRVGAIAQATGSEMDELKKSALDLGASTSKSASEVAAGQEELAAMGFSVNQIIGAMPGVISAAEASGADMAQTASVMASSLNMFGLEASEANRVADILAQTANVSAADITDMQYALKYAGPPANALGVSLEELSASIGIMTDAGMKGEQAGTTLRGALLGLLDPSEENSKMMNSMGIAITDNEGNFVGLSNLIRNLQGSMEGQTETQKAATLSALVGKEAVSGMLSLMKAGPDKIDEFTKSLENSGGASEKAAGIMRDNLKGALDEMGGAFETASIEIGSILTPMLTDLAGKVQSLTQKFIDLSPETKKTILVVAGIAAAIAPVVVGFATVGAAVAGFMLTVAPLTGAIVAAGGLVPAIGALGGGLVALATGPIGIAVGAIAAIGIGAVALGSHLKKDALPEVDRFGKGVSESTKEALGGFFDLSDGAANELTKLSISGDVVTKDMAMKLTSTFGQMNKEILDGMKKRHTDEMKETQTFFMNSSALTTEREQEILNNQKAGNTKKEQEQHEYGARINAIVNKAAAEKRELTQQEKEQINTIQQQMNENAVVYLTDNERDQKVILERMKSTASNLSAQQAAAVVKESATARDKVIKDADKKFNDVVAFATKERDETGSMSASEAQAVIQEAKKQRDESVGHAKNKHKDVVAEAQKQAKGHVKEIDWETGQVKSKWEVMRTSVVDTAKKLGKGAKDAGSDMWKGIKKDSSDGWAQTKLGWNDMTTNVSNKAKDLKDKTTKFFSDKWNSLKTSTSNGASNIKTGWNDLKNNVVTKVSDLSTSAKTKYNDMKNSLVQKTTDIKNGISNGFTAAKDKVVETVNSMKTKALGVFTDIVSGAKALPGKMKDGIVSMASKAVDGIRNVGNKMATMFGSVVNGLVGGLNSILKSLKIPGGGIPTWKVPQFAYGTDSHKGGLMVVGDKFGREIVELPNGQSFISPDTDTLVNAPKGTRVIPNKITEQYLSGDIPHFAKGAGVVDWVKDKATSFKNALSNIWDHVSNPGKLIEMMGLPSLSGATGGFGTLIKGASSMIREKTVEYIKNMFGKAAPPVSAGGAYSNTGTGPGGAGSGFPGFGYSSGYGWRIHPITGKRKFHNGDDYPAPAGKPIPNQVAGTVIRSEKGSGAEWPRGNFVQIRTGAYDRVYQHNSRNLVSRGQFVEKGKTVGLVGSTGSSTGNHLHYEVWKNGKPINPRGLATGGRVDENGLFELAEEGYPEFVIPTAPKRRTDAMKLLALAGKAIGGGGSSAKGPNQLSGGSSGGGVFENMLNTLLQQNQMMSEQNSLLMKLLQKSTDVFLDGKLVGEGVFETVDAMNYDKTSVAAYMKGVRI